MKRITAAIIIFLLVIATLPGFAYHEGFGYVNLESGYEIFKNTMYQEYTGDNSKRGLVKSYTVISDLERSGLKPFVFSGDVSGSYTLETMVSKVEQMGYKVVAAINGDIFDTASNSPRGTVIHDGNIITSGYQSDRIITFDEDNNIAMKTVGLKYSYEALDRPEIKGSISFFNVQDGGGGGVFLYNKNYGAYTGTKGEKLEIVIEAEDDELSVDKEILGVVKKISNKGGTPVSKGELVLSFGKGSNGYNDVLNIKPGDEIVISVEDTLGELAQVKEGFGLYHQIVENNRIVTSGTNVNPRTAMGVKSDGQVVMYVSDGRQANVGNGLTIEELAYHMIELGCEEAWNLDGGGSSQLLARKPGVDQTAALRNSPSEGTARKVANGLLLVYDESTSASLKNLHLYPERYITILGEQVKLKAYGSNSLYEKISISGDIAFSADSGTVSNNAFIPQKIGRSKITALYQGLSAEAEIETVSDVNIVLPADKWNLSPQSTKKVTAKLAYGKMILDNITPSLTFSADEKIGAIDSEGNFRAAALKSEVQGYITVGYMNNTAKILVTVTPTKIVPVEFLDTASHWAKNYIGVLASMGKVQGVGDNMFMPDSPLTRAQFVAFLAKATDNINIESAQTAGFKDVNQKDWSYNYVNWGYQEGIVNGMGEGLFKPDDPITREQMAVMLCNYAVYQNFALPQKEGLKVSFKDKNRISYWAMDYVYTVAGSEIMTGMGDNTFMPQGIATRGQAAKIIHEYIDLREGIND